MDTNAGVGLQKGGRPMTDMERPELFHRWIERHARGSLDQEATLALADVVKAVTDLEKKGEVVIKVVIEPAGSGGRAVAIGGTVTAKPPTPAPELGVFYPDAAGGLHRDDPYQTRIPGAVVAADDGEEPRVVETTTGEVRRVDDEGGTDE